MFKVINWKTLVSGIVASIGGALQASDNPTAKLIGTVLLSLGSLLLGAAAKDKNVTGGTKQQ